MNICRGQIALQVQPALVRQTNFEHDATRRVQAIALQEFLSDSNSSTRKPTDRKHLSIALRMGLTQALSPMTRMPVLFNSYTITAPRLTPPLPITKFKVDPFPPLARP